MENQAEPNAEIVKRAYRAFIEADFNTLSELFDDNCTWHSPGRNPMSGDNSGKEEVFTQFGHYGNDTLGTFKPDLKHVLTCDHNRVVGVHHTTAERNGKKLDTLCCIYFKIENGKIMSGKEFFYDQYNWDEFWA